MGLGWVDIALIVEEFGRSLIHSPVADTVVSTDIIARYGTTAQKSVLLPEVAAGRIQFATAIAEPGEECGPGGVTARLSPITDGWRLRGTKMLVPECDTPGRILVAARFGDTGSLGFVLINPSTAGISSRPHSTLDPASKLRYVELKDVEVRPHDVLGDGAVPTGAVERAFDLLGTAAALELVGIAGRVLDLSVEYAKVRVQFGKPIGSFQAIKHRCADMAVLLDTARSTAYYAAWAVSENIGDREKTVSMAKAYCGDAARTICNDGLQIHGGMGFTWELGLHYYLRRAKLLEFIYGDAAYHRERVVAATLDELGVQG
jgi:alkylation response protein AidB-like acyl-CoA dehydrogenase